MAKGETPLCPYQLVGKKAAYLPFYFEFPWNETAGAAGVRIEFTDWFSHTQNFSKEFSVRHPDSFEGGGFGGQAVLMRPGTQGLSPSAQVSPENSGAISNIASLGAPLAIPFALGALLLVRAAFAVRDET